MRTRKGITLSELAIALSLTATIALLAVGLLNMGSRASTLTRSANEAITYEVEFTETVKTAVSSSASIYTIPDGIFTQEKLTEGWNYIGLMDSSEFGEGGVPESVLSKVGVSGSTPITEGFTDSTGTAVDAGKVLVQIEYAGETEPTAPEDGVIMQSTDVSGTKYFIVHVLGYDYTAADGTAHVYKFEAAGAKVATSSSAADGISIKVVETSYTQDAGATTWTAGATSIVVDTVIAASNAHTIDDSAAGTSVAMAYRLPNTQDPNTKSADFTIAILMDTSLSRDDNQTTAYQNRMSDTMYNGVTRFNNMKTSVNKLLTELSKYDNGNIVLIPFSYVGAANGNFYSGRPDSTTASLTFNSAGDVEAARDLLDDLRLSGGSNPGDAVRVLYNELSKIEMNGSVGELSIIMFTGREMGSWSTHKVQRGNLDSTADTSYFYADRDREGYNAITETYPAYVRTNYYYWENGYYDAAFWMGQSATWITGGDTIGSGTNTDVDEYVPDNELKITKEQYTRWRGAIGFNQVHAFRQDALKKMRNYFKGQVQVLREDFTISKYDTVLLGAPEQVENLYLVALWNIDGKTNEKQAFIDAGFKVYANYTALPQEALENIKSTIKKATAPNGL